MSGSTQVADTVSSQAMSVLKLLLNDYHPRDFTVRLWDGSQWPAETTPARFTLQLKHPSALRQMMQKPSTDLSMAEAYIQGDLDIDGDLESAMPMAHYLFDHHWPIATSLQIAWNLPVLPGNGTFATSHPPPPDSGRVHSIERDRRSVGYHYNVSNDFYALWLDQQMVYSCGYFETASTDLDTAQTRKLDYLCRKLRLQPGDHLLDIGCGWGGLILHAVRHYGVNALGITLSQNQADWARERIAHAGLQTRCRVELRDFRELTEYGHFDKLVSVGMFEHVGEENLPLYFKQAQQLLRPGGLFLNHGIARNTHCPASPQAGFIGRYVFPDSELIPIHLSLRHAETAGFELRDLESLREHYVLTLRQWTQRLGAHRDRALQTVDPPTYRIWRLFLAGSAYGFATGSFNLYQVLMVKPHGGQSGLPLTRADWYR